MDSRTRQQAIFLYDRFTHGGLDRRAFMAEMVKLAGSVAAAEVLIANIAASPAAAAIVPENDPRLATRTQTIAGYTAYVAEPRARSLAPTVIVIHENRGLNGHIKDVSRRLALAGFRAVAPDMLTPSGGTPTNEDAARSAIEKLDLGKSVSDAVAIVSELKGSSRGGRIGAVGFCWAGGFVNRLIIAAGSKLDAAVVYYGPAPAPSEAAKVEAPVEFHNAGLDDRVNATSFLWIEALRRAGKRVKFFLYPGANHAFNNDTSAERYSKPAADLAWKRTLGFLRHYLG